MIPMGYMYKRVASRPEWLKAGHRFHATLSHQLFRSTSTVCSGRLSKPKTHWNGEPSTTLNPGRIVFLLSILSIPDHHSSGCAHTTRAPVTPCKANGPLPSTSPMKSPLHINGLFCFSIWYCYTDGLIGTGLTLSSTYNDQDLTLNILDTIKH